MSQELVPLGDKSIETIRGELETSGDTTFNRAAKKVAIAALGSIPWVGGFLAAAAEFREEREQIKINRLQQEWLQAHQAKLERLEETLKVMTERLSHFGQQAEERMESEPYLQLVHQGFRTWDQADTDEKRELIRKLLTNAGAKKICDDDLLRLFLDWIDRYHESHFKVIRAVHELDGPTRADIWDEIYGPVPRDNSAEADLFKLLIYELTVGHVIRQERTTTNDGRFLKKRTPTRTRSPTMKSPFDSKERYELTELGKEFVHYVLTDLVPQLGSAPNDSDRQS